LNSKRNAIRQDASLCFCAAAEEKLRKIEDILGRLLSKAGFYVFIARRYGTGAHNDNSLRVRVSSTPVKAPVERIDYLFLLLGGLRPDVINHIASKTKVVGDVGTITRDSPKLREREAAIVELPLAARMKELDCGTHEAEAMAGMAAALFGLSVESSIVSLNVLFQRRDQYPEAVTAFRLGHALGIEVGEGILVARYLRSDKNEILIDADTALSLGTAAGGCNFVASPFPGALFDFYSNNAECLGAVTLRAEDKAGALNMCIGAAYTGARALFTTSDGCSVREAIETASFSETPLVIHTTPRYDPADMNTDEGQRLNAALCFGHGEFPCVVYSPVSVESAFALGTRAFAAAEKFRIPVLLMTDPYLSKTAYDMEPLRPSQEKENFPRGVPGYALDDREDAKERNVFKGVALKLRPEDERMRKLAVLRENALSPKLFGNPLYRTLIVFWGALQETLLEVLRTAETEGRFDTKSVALLSCEQVYPLSDQIGIFLKQAHRLIFVEHNATGQFARFVQAETGCIPTDILLKYGEGPFSVEDLTERLQNLLAPKEAAPPKTKRSELKAEIKTEIGKITKKDAEEKASGFPGLPVVAQLGSLAARTASAASPVDERSEGRTL
jgi:2-oxoglutarate ferredoxin oxidoreductase subunit alpha